MKKVRFDIFLDPEDNRKLLKLKDREGRSRKGQVEYLVKKAVEDID